jgi:hypothetical protein
MMRLGMTLAGLVAAFLAAVALYLYLDRAEALRAVSEAKAAHAKDQAAWATQREVLVQEALKESERARQTEAQWREKQTEVQKNAQERIRAAVADAARARDAVDVLQQRAKVLAAQCSPSRDQAGPDPTFAERGAAAADPGTVLTNMLRGVAAAAAELAAVADARGAAGAACEKAYGVLK